VKAVVLLSGGIDSTTTLAIARESFSGDDILALSISYGQKNVRELERAAIIAEYYKCTWKVILLPPGIFGKESGEFLCAVSKTIIPDFEIVLNAEHIRPLQHL